MPDVVSHFGVELGHSVSSLHGGLQVPAVPPERRLEYLEKFYERTLLANPVGSKVLVRFLVQVLSELGEDGRVRTYEFDPAALLGDYAAPQELAGGDPAHNAALTRRVLSGEKGAARDIVCLNAAAAIVAGRRAPRIEEGWRLAQQSIDGGHAMKALERLIALTAAG